jgi:hypothetical protein
MKGIVFSTDALIAISLALLLLSLIPLTFERRYAGASLQVLGYQANDLMNVLTVLTASEVKDKPTIQNLIANGILQEKDLNKILLDLIGTFWYSGNKSIAENITRETLEGLTDKCFKLEAENEIIYNKTCPESSTVAVAFRTASGYGIGKPVAGYIARAWATKVKKNNTLIVKGDVISSSVKKPTGGNNLNEVNITYDLNIPSSAVLIDSYWFIEAAWTDNKLKAYINGVYIPGSSAFGSVLLTHLNSYLQPGHNSLTVVYSFGFNGEEGGDDGASHFVLNYSIEKKETLPPRDKVYFANVYSNSSIRYKKPIFIPGDVKNLTVNLTLIGSTATLRLVFEGQTYNISTKNVVNNNAYWNDSEIRNALNAYNLHYSNFSSKYFWFVVEVDTYHSLEYLGPGRAVLNSSYVEINATYRTQTYGYIDLTRIVPIYSKSSQDWDGFYRDVEWRFNSSGIPLTLDSQLAWLYYSGSNPSQEIEANSITLYEHPPQPLIVELARFGYTNTSGEITTGTNSYSMKFGNGYAINPSNSLVDYTYLLPSLVGYGDVFNTSELAVDDATKRLKNLWVGEDLSLVDVSVENKSLYGIQWLWGPGLFKLSVW